MFKKLLLFSLIIYSLFQTTCSSIKPEESSENLLIPVLQPQSGHTGSIFSTAISPDNQYIVSAGSDDNIILWDIKSGKEIRKFTGGYGIGINSVDFSYNGKYIISGGYDDNGLVRIWDPVTGNEINTVEILSRLTKQPVKSIECIDTAPNNNYAAIGTDGKTMAIINIKSGSVRTTYYTENNIVYTCAYSPDDRYIAAAGNGHCIEIFSSNGGKVKTLEPGNFRDIYTVAFSPNGKELISGNDRGDLILWNINSGEQIKIFEGFGSGINSAHFSHDGAYILAGGYDNKVCLFNKQTDQRIWENYTYPIYSLAFSEDDNYFIAGGGDSGEPYLELFYTETGNLLKSFKGHTYIIYDAAFSNDNNSILSGGGGLYNGYFSLYDLNECKAVWNIRGHSGWINSVMFSPDKKYFITGSQDRTAILWETAGGKFIRYFQSDTYISQSVYTAAFSHDNKYIATGGRSASTIFLYDLNTGELIKNIDPFPGETSSIMSVSFSPDSRFIVSEGDYYSSYIWDLENDRLHTDFREMLGLSDNILTTDFSADSRKFQYYSDNGFYRVIDLETLKTENEIQLIDYNYPISADISPDNRFIATADCINQLCIWNLETGIQEKQFEKHDKYINSIAFSNDSRSIITGNWDGTTTLWDIETGQSVTFMASPETGEWIVYTNDGYWDSSEKGGDLVAMVYRMDVWNIDQFAAKNNRPDIILSRLGSDNEELINHFHNQYLKRLSRMGLTEEDLSPDYHVPKAEIVNSVQNGKSLEIEFILKDELYNLIRYNIYVNDVPVFGTYGKNINDNKITLTYSIELTSGENKIEVSCINEKGAESYRALTYATYDKEVKGDLYFIGFGVSEYLNSELNLSYADKDVTDLSSLLELTEGNQFENVYIKLYINNECTVSNIRNAKLFLDNASVDDIFILLISGHGKYDLTEEATYYYLTYESDVTNLSETAADFELIESILQDIAPRQKLFLLDTCESGELDENKVTTYFNFAEQKGILPRTTRGLTVLEKEADSLAVRNFLHSRDRFIYNDLIRRSGAVVFSSCRGGELSYESNAYENGFFTEMLMSALINDKCDLNDDGIISINELRDYVAENVSEMSGGYQNPTIDRNNIFIRMGFNIIEAGN